MRVRPMIWAALLASLLVAGTARASTQCGIQPILPIGCDDAVCICDDEGNCSWVYICE